MNYACDLWYDKYWTIRSKQKILFRKKGTMYSLLDERLDISHRNLLVSSKLQTPAMISRGSPCNEFGVLYKVSFSLAEP